MDARSSDAAIEQHDADGNVVWRGYPPDEPSAATRYGFWAHAQTWLQGCYPNAWPRPWPMVALGNLISEFRYRTWRLTGGKHYGEQ